MLMQRIFEGMHHGQVSLLKGQDESGRSEQVGNEEAQVSDQVLVSYFVLGKKIQPRSGQSSSMSKHENLESRYQHICFHSPMHSFSKDRWTLYTVSASRRAVHNSLHRKDQAG